jgi:hypothetical protein
MPAIGDSGEIGDQPGRRGSPATSAQRASRKERNYLRGARTHPEELEKVREEALLKLRGRRLSLSPKAVQPFQGAPGFEGGAGAGEDLLLRYYNITKVTQSASVEAPETSTSTATGGETLPLALLEAWRHWSSCRAL